MRRTWKAGLLLSALTLAGCSTTGPFGREKLALPIGPSYVGGRGTQMFPTSPAILTNVKAGMADVGVDQIVQNEDPSGLVILEGKAADDRKVRVTVQSSGRNTTISVKVGWLGDEPLTRALLDRIAIRQGTIPPPPATQGTETSDTEASGPPPKTQPLLSRGAVPDSVMLQGQFESGIRPSPY